MILTRPLGRTVDISSLYQTVQQNSSCKLYVSLVSDLMVYRGALTVHFNVSSFVLMVTIKIEIVVHDVRRNSGAFVPAVQNILGIRVRTHDLENAQQGLPLGFIFLVSA